MIEVYPNLFVGSQADEAAIRGQPGWFVVHACKEPYHRDALGYTGRGAPKNHPEYLVAERDSRLILNLVDVDAATFIPQNIHPEVKLGKNERAKAQSSDRAVSVGHRVPLSYPALLSLRAHFGAGRLHEAGPESHIDEQRRRAAPNCHR